MGVLMYERNSVIRQFEKTIAKHCGSPYAVAVESCTAALILCFLYFEVKHRVAVVIPKKTYFSVPMSVIHAGGTVQYEDIEWQGAYQLWPYPIIDSAMRFKKDMYRRGNFQCLSFHYAKHLPIGRGGMILTDNKKARDWFRIMRNDGRREIPKEKDNVRLFGYNFYMTPEQAARGLSLFYWRFHGQPDQPDLPNNHGDVSHVC
jgi:dTDP-4-amino-4,6-dideoxygalactose transaminase